MSPLTVGISAVTERWYALIGYEGRYEVSDQGDVRSWLKHKKGSLLSQHPGGDGYLRVTLFDANGRRRFQKVHVLLLTTAVGPAGPGQVCRHLDGDRCNNKLSNLSWGSVSQNARDSIRHGTQSEIRKTHCPQGHPYSGSNLYVTAHGHRECRACAREQSSAYRKRRDARNRR